MRASLRPTSILVAQLLSHLAPVLVVTGVLAAFVFSTARTSLEAEVGRKLRDIARIAARDVPLERLELIQPDSGQTRMVRRLNAKLDAVRRSAGVAAIEVCDARGQVLLDSQGVRAIGEACPRRPTAEALAGLARGDTVSTGSFTERDTRYMAAFSPVADSTGRLFATIVVRSGAREVDVVVRMQTRLIVASALTVVFGVGLAVLLAGWLARPIRDVAAIADEIGQGRYAARVAPPPIRELAQLAGSINSMAEQVERRDRKLKAMAGTVAHEVRNPLNSVGLLLTLLDEELSAAGHVSQQPIVEMLHDEVGRLDRVLTGFLTWSRPVVLTDEAVDALEPAARAVQMARAAAAEADVHVALVEGPAIAARLDAQRVEQALLNLVLNAIQASPAGAAVEVEVNNAGASVDYIVRDRGAGLSPEVRARLFEPFFTTRAKGTGLGLANARALAEAHGGTLVLEDRVDGGTRAVLRIPREVA